MYKDEDFDDPRRLAVGRDGMALDHQIRGYVNKHLLDGQLAEYVLPVLAPHAFIGSQVSLRKAVAKLVEHGYLHAPGETCTSTKCPLSELGEVPPGHFVVHDWWSSQERAEKVKVRRDKHNRKKDLLGDEFLVKALIARDGMMCRYCGRHVQKRSVKDTRSKDKLTIDHVDEDGPNTLENLVIACQECNNSVRGVSEDDKVAMLLPSRQARLARLGHIEHPDTLRDPAPRADDHHRDQTIDQTIDQESGLVGGLVDQAERDHGPDHGPCDSSRTGASHARDARDSGRTRTGAWSGGLVGAGSGLVGGLVPDRAGLVESGVPPGDGSVPVLRQTGGAIRLTRADPAHPSNREERV